MTTIPGSQLSARNSTSYVDMLGVLVGLERIEGESSDAFARRIDLAVATPRGADFEGLLSSLNLVLGLEMRQALQVSHTAEFDLQVRFGSLDVTSSSITAHVDLLALDIDDFWKWKRLSEVAAELQTAGFSAELTGADGFALELPVQRNSGLITAEPLNGSKTQRLSRGPVVADSIRFSGQVPSYTVGSDGQILHFLSPPSQEVSVTYRYRKCPYRVVASPVSAFSLTDPALAQWAVGSNGKVIYQVREYVQEILRADGSYWGR